MDKRYFFSHTVDLFSQGVVVVFFFLDLVENLFNIEILVHVLFPGLMTVRITCLLTKNGATIDKERLNVNCLRDKADCESNHMQTTPRRI